VDEYDDDFEDYDEDFEDYNEDNNDTKSSRKTDKPQTKTTSAKTSTPAAAANAIPSDILKIKESMQIENNAAMAMVKEASPSSSSSAKGKILSPQENKSSRNPK